jgi:Fe-S-cluster containining protein
MSDLIKKDGFSYAFDHTKCSTCNGRCCTGESGNIFLSIKELEDIALFLKLSNDQFIKMYLRKVGFKFSIKEKIVGMSHDCIFYDRESNGCMIYSVRPSQCITFPFWDYYKTRVEELKIECPGVIDD